MSPSTLSRLAALPRDPARPDPAGRDRACPGGAGQPQCGSAYLRHRSDPLGKRRRAETLLRVGVTCRLPS